MTCRITVFAAALASSALISGAALAGGLGAAGNLTGAAGTTIQGPTSGATTGAMGTVNGAANAGTTAGSNTTVNPGTTAVGNSTVNAGTNADVNANAQTGGKAGGGAHAGVGARTGVTANPNLKAGMKAGANGAATAGAGINDLTARQAVALSGRTVVGKGGAVLGTIQKVQKGADGMSTVYLRTAAGTGLKGKVVKLPAAMFSGQASGAARAGSRLTAPTVSKADLRAMPSAAANAQGSVNSM